MVACTGLIWLRMGTNGGLLWTRYWTFVGGHGLFFSFVIFFTETVGALGRGISPLQGRYLHKEQHKHKINAQTFVPSLRLEPTIPASERVKTVHALDRAATVIGREPSGSIKCGEIHNSCITGGNSRRAQLREVLETTETSGKKRANHSRLLSTT
jgi:hypothetical protein